MVQRRFFENPNFLKKLKNPKSLTARCLRLPCAPTALKVVAAGHLLSPVALAATALHTSSRTIFFLAFFAVSWWVFVVFLSFPVSPL